MQQWKALNKHNDRDVCYSSSKENFGIENKNFLEVKKFRDVFIWFQFGISDLLHNKNFANLPVVNENEEHFLLSYPVYEQIRKKHLDRL